MVIFLLHIGCTFLINDIEKLFQLGYLGRSCDKTMKNLIIFVLSVPKVLRDGVKLNFLIFFPQVHLQLTLGKVKNYEIWVA